MRTRGRGVKNSGHFVYVISGSPLMRISGLSLSGMTQATDTLWNSVLQKLPNTRILIMGTDRRMSIKGGGCCIQIAVLIRILVLNYGYLEDFAQLTCRCHLN